MVRRQRTAKVDCLKKLMNMVNHDKKKEQTNASKHVPRTRVKLKRQRISSSESDSTSNELPVKEDRKSKPSMHLINDKLPATITSSADTVKLNVDANVNKKISNAKAPSNRTVNKRNRIKISEKDKSTADHCIVDNSREIKNCGQDTLSSMKQNDKINCNQKVGMSLVKDSLKVKFKADSNKEISSTDVTINPLPVKAQNADFDSKHVEVHKTADDRKKKKSHKTSGISSMKMKDTEFDVHLVDRKTNSKVKEKSSTSSMKMKDAEFDVHIKDRKTSAKVKEKTDCDRKEKVSQHMSVERKDETQSKEYKTDPITTSTSLSKIRDEPDSCTNIDSQIKQHSDMHVHNSLSDDSHSNSRTEMTPMESNMQGKNSVSEIDEDKKTANLIEKFRKRKLLKKLGSEKSEEEPPVKRLSLSEDRPTTSTPKASTPSENEDLHVKRLSLSQDRPSTSTQETEAVGGFKLPSISKHSLSSLKESREDRKHISFPFPKESGCSSKLEVSFKDSYSEPSKEKEIDDDNISLFADSVILSFEDYGLHTPQKENSCKDKLKMNPFKGNLAPEKTSVQVNKTCAENSPVKILNSSSNVSRTSNLDVPMSVVSVPDQMTVKTVSQNKNKASFNNQRRIILPKTANSMLTIQVKNCHDERVREETVQTSPVNNISNQPNEVTINRIVDNLEVTESCRKNLEVNKQSNQISASSEPTENSALTNVRSVVNSGEKILLKDLRVSLSRIDVLLTAQNRFQPPVHEKDKRLIGEQTRPTVQKNTQMKNMTEKPAVALCSSSNKPDIIRKGLPVLSDNTNKISIAKYGQIASSIVRSKTTNDAQAKSSTAPVCALNAVTRNKTCNNAQQRQSGKSQSTALIRSNSVESVFLDDQHNKNENSKLLHPQANCKNISYNAHRPNNLIRSNSMESVFNEPLRIGPISSVNTTTNAIVPNKVNRFLPAAVAGGPRQALQPSTSNPMNVTINPSLGRKLDRSAFKDIISPTDIQNGSSQAADKSHNFNIKNSDESSVVVQKYIDSQRGISDSQRNMSVTKLQTRKPITAPTSTVTNIRPHPIVPSQSTFHRPSRLNARVVSERNLDPSPDSDEEDDDIDVLYENGARSTDLVGDMQSPCEFLKTGHCDKTFCSSSHEVEPISVKNKTKYEASLMHLMQKGLNYAYTTSVRYLARELVMLPVLPDKSEWENLVKVLHTCSRKPIQSVLEEILTDISDLNVRSSTMNVLFEMIINNDAIYSTWTKEFQKLISRSEVQCPPEIIAAYMRKCVKLRPTSRPFTFSVFDILISKTKTGTLLKIPIKVVKMFAHHLRMYDPSRVTQLTQLINVDGNQNSLSRDNSASRSSLSSDSSVPGRHNYAANDNMRCNVNKFNDEQHQRYLSGGSEHDSSVSFHSGQEPRPQFRKPASKHLRDNVTDSTIVNNNAAVSDLRNNLNLQKVISCPERRLQSHPVASFRNNVSPTRYQRPICPENSTSNTYRNSQFSVDDQLPNTHSNEFLHSDLPSLGVRTERLAQPLFPSLQSTEIHNSYNNTARQFPYRSSNAITNHQNLQGNYSRHNQQTQRFHHNEGGYRAGYHRGGNVSHPNYRRPFFQTPMVPQSIAVSSTDRFRNHMEMPDCSFAMTQQLPPLQPATHALGANNNIDERIIHLKQCLQSNNTEEVVRILICDKWSDHWARYADAIYAMLSGDLYNAPRDFRRLLDEAVPHFLGNPGHGLHILSKVGDKLVEELKNEKRFQHVAEIRRALRERIPPKS